MNFLKQQFQGGGGGHHGGGHAPVQLPAFPAHIGVFPTFYAQQSETLILKEKVMSLTGDTFDIKTIDGRGLFQVKGEVFSMSGRKNISDMNGNHLFTIRKKHLALHSTYYAEDPQGNQIFEVVSKFTIGKSRAVGKFTSASGKPESLMMNGNWFDTQANIVEEASQQPVATIQRKLSLGEFFGQQTYAVTVAPNVDLAIIVAMCICFDEKNNENNNTVFVG